MTPRGLLEVVCRDRTRVKYKERLLGCSLQCFITDRYSFNHNLDGNQHEKNEVLAECRLKFETIQSYGGAFLYKMTVDNCWHSNCWGYVHTPKQLQFSGGWYEFCTKAWIGKYRPKQGSCTENCAIQIYHRRPDALRQGWLVIDQNELEWANL